jgi:hypothetical protein
MSTARMKIVPMGLNPPHEARVLAHPVERAVGSQGRYEDSRRHVEQRKRRRTRWPRRPRVADPEQPQMFRVQNALFLWRRHGRESMPPPDLSPSGALPSSRAGGEFPHDPLMRSTPSTKRDADALVRIVDFPASTMFRLNGATPYTRKPRGRRYADVV